MALITRPCDLMFPDFKNGKITVSIDDGETTEYEFVNGYLYSAQNIMWCQPLTEFERGCGNRPDGFVLAHSKSKLKEAVDKMMAEQRAYFLSLYGNTNAPDEYTAPTGSPYACLSNEEPGRYFGKLPERKEE